ncbi:MAG: DUF86 domain-containing protein [Candidatus Mycalebacterium zealandia]|nr:MAG: DUF86 domain-containing protein [Candidatus Mycalebacterium zealandia]
MLIQVSGSAEKIIGWFQDIKSAEDFSSPEGQKTLDAICMNLIAMGESIKKIDEKMDGSTLSDHGEVPWTDMIRTRDFFAHHYFRIEKEEVFDICENDIPKLRETLKKMLKDLG